jgi:hypothetical protein
MNKKGSWYLSSNDLCRCDTIPFSFLFKFFFTLSIFIRFTLHLRDEMRNCWCDFLIHIYLSLTSIHINSLCEFLRSLAELVWPVSFNCFQLRSKSRQNKGSEDDLFIKMFVHDDGMRKLQCLKNSPMRKIKGYFKSALKSLLTWWREVLFLHFKKTSNFYHYFLTL